MLFPEIQILAGHLHMIVILGYIFNTLRRQFRNTLFMKHYIFQLLINILLVGQDIDNGTKFCFIQYLIVLRLTPTTVTPFAIANSEFMEGVYEYN